MLAFSAVQGRDGSPHYLTVSIRSGKVWAKSAGTCPCGRARSPKLISDSETPYPLDLMDSLISTLVGAAIGSVLGYASQFILQRREWRQRDREREKERSDRELEIARERKDRDAERDQERRERESAEIRRQEELGDAAVKSLAVEALWNSIQLSTTAIFENGADRQPPRIELAREQFDHSMILALHRLQGNFAQQTFNTYLAAFSLQQFRDARSVFHIGDAERKRIANVSQSFEIVFRVLGSRVFSKEEMLELEKVRNVAYAEMPQKT
jgi:hypothetical protein